MIIPEKRKRGPKPKYDHVKEELYLLRQKGYSYGEISEAYTISKTQVRNLILQVDAEKKRKR